MTKLTDRTPADFRTALAGEIKGVRDRLERTRTNMAARQTHPADWWWQICYNELRRARSRLVQAQERTGLQDWLRAETGDATFEFDALLLALITAMDAVIVEVAVNYPTDTDGDWKYVSLDGNGDVQFLQIDRVASSTLRSLMGEVVTAADALV